MALLSNRIYKNASDESNLKRDVDESMLQLEPDAAPLYVLTNANKRAEGTKTPKFEWHEDAEAALWGQVSNGSTDYASNATVIAVADGTIFAVDDLVLVLQSTGASKSKAEEVVLVTDVSGNNLTISRGIGSASSADTISATNPLRILGQACVEGSGVPTYRTTQKVAKSSYIQFFKTPVKTSELLQGTELFTGDERRLQQSKALVRHRSEIEAAGLWGRGSATDVTTGYRFTTQGFKPTVSTNITDASTTLSYTSMLKFGETGFRFGEKSKLCMAGPSVLSAFDYFSVNKLMTNVEANVFGVNIKKIVTNHGTYQIANNFRMEAGIAGGAGFDDELYLINLPTIKFRFLNGGKNLNTRLVEDIVKDGVDATIDEYKSYVGWQVGQEKTHARMYNVTAFA